MNQYRSLFTVFFVLMAAGAAAVYGQPETRQQVEPSYDVSLQLLIGSNAASGQGDVPDSLGAVSKQLKTAFSFSNYRLASTFLGRIANTGNFEYKSVTNVFGEADARSGSFLEWSMSYFTNTSATGGKTAFQAQSFRFGAKVPIVTGSYKDESGKMNPVIQYESIGLNLKKVGLPENVPTLIGTLNLPGADGTIFLVMTVKAAEF